MIIDASNLILGRMASVAARKALLGEEITIVNCEKAIITGRKNSILRKYRLKLELGQPSKGPFFPRKADRLVRRVVRGMLPWKRARGREAWKRVKCFVDVPLELDKGKFETVKMADIQSSSARSFITVKELCRLIGK